MAIYWIFCEDQNLKKVPTRFYRNQTLLTLHKTLQEEWVIYMLARSVVDLYTVLTLCILVMEHSLPGAGGHMFNSQLDNSRDYKCVNRFCT